MSARDVLRGIIVTSRRIGAYRDRSVLPSPAQSRCGVERVDVGQTRTRLSYIGEGQASLAPNFMHLVHAGCATVQGIKLGGC